MSMANNNLDPVHLAKSVSDQMVRFPRGKSLEWKIKQLKWKFEKQNFGDCYKMIIDGATVVLKVEEKLSEMEAKAKIGEGGEKLRLKVDHVKRKVERYHFLMHMLAVSKNPGEFAACAKNFNMVRKGGKCLLVRSDAKLSEESPAKDIKRMHAREESQSAKDVEEMKVKEKAEDDNNLHHIFASSFPSPSGVGQSGVVRKLLGVMECKIGGSLTSGSLCSKACYIAEMLRMKERYRKARHGHNMLIQLSNRSYEQFVAWKGNWSKGRAYVVSETGASVKNRPGTQFFISGHVTAIPKAINMIVTQTPTDLASSSDFAIVEMG